MVFDVLIRARQHAQKSPILKAVLPKPPRVSLRNPKPLRDKLLRSKLKLTDDTERGKFPYGRGNYEIYNVLRPGKGLKAHLKDLQLYDEGRRQLLGENWLNNFFNHDYEGSCKDMMEQIIDFYDSKDQKKCEDFWMHQLRTLYLERLNIKRINHIKCFNWVVEYIFSCARRFFYNRNLNIGES